MGEAYLHIAKAELSLWWPLCAWGAERAHPSPAEVNSVLTTATPPPTEAARVPALPSPQLGGLGVLCGTGPS